MTDHKKKSNFYVAAIQLKEAIFMYKYDVIYVHVIFMYKYMFHFIIAKLYIYIWQKVIHMYCDICLYLCMNVWYLYCFYLNAMKFWYQLAIFWFTKN